VPPGPRVPVLNAATSINPGAEDAEGNVTPRIDFNCDMGESFGAYTLGLDREMISHITSANIACGFHAGDPGCMRITVALAEAHGVGVGAHPGFPDLRGFGRRALAASASEVKDDLIYQIGALTAFTRTRRLQHVKPHGALYNMAVEREDLARAIAEAVLETDPTMMLVALAGSPWAATAERLGVRVAREVFADRAFNANGTLVPRNHPGAVIHDTSAVVERSLRLVTEGEVEAITGETVTLEADTICLHGDTPGAVILAVALRDAFARAGVGLVPMARLLAS
jgi:5-oxoprolinase (ATP-hydrolysing) subunit A